MPLYEYDCPGCGRDFEKRMPMSQADQAVCPNCGSEYPARRLSRISVKGQSGSAAMSAAPVLSTGGG
ncbi:MAG: zinc ribbon domain-containing protein [Anaerolineae bacterium]|nr:zinc ribbon domain-containing protein [Anaerolineae bacterium]